MSKQERSTLLRAEMSDFSSDNYKWKAYRLNKWHTWALKVAYIIASILGVALPVTSFFL